MKMTWDNVSERYYSTGVSEVALFVQDSQGAYGTGVPWSGVTSIEENPDGGDANDFYADNIKYLSLRAVEDFAGSITAYQSPEEFDVCDGIASIATGVKIGQQVRRPFGLVYKTQIGNYTDGPDHGYEIHIIYNATASPSSKSHETINDSPEPAELSWDIETTPIPVTGHKPTSTIVIDSTKIDAAKLTTIEESLYGKGETSGTNDPTLLLPADILRIINGQ